MCLCVCLCVCVFVKERERVCVLCVRKRKYVCVLCVRKRKYVCVLWLCCACCIHVHGCIPHPHSHMHTIVSHTQFALTYKHQIPLPPPLLFTHRRMRALHRLHLLLQQQQQPSTTTTTTSSTPSSRFTPGVSAGIAVGALMGVVAPLLQQIIMGGIAGDNSRHEGKQVYIYSCIYLQIINTVRRE